MLAYIFHFQPSELWNMDGKEIAFWNKRAVEIARILRSRR